jgi:hypothetical protein
VEQLEGILSNNKFYLVSLLDSLDEINILDTKSNKNKLFTFENKILQMKTTYFKRGNNSKNQDILFILAVEQLQIYKVEGL